MARREVVIETELYSATRLRNSVNGNPRFDLHTSDGTFRTQSDSMCNYEVTNFTGLISYGKSLPVRLRMTQAQRVYGIEGVKRDTHEGQQSE